MELRSSSRGALRLVLWIGVPALLFIAFPLYLWSLYGQLQTAFHQQNEFIPTRIYSDVTRIALPHPKSLVQERLKVLGYAPQFVGSELRFQLHALDYPSYLIPENHPQLDAPEGQVVLHFDAEDSKALLHSIEINGREIPDLYLEPEPVATLTKSGGTSEAKREIRSYLKFEEIPAPVWQAIIAIEDQHFLEHKGFDPKGLARAVFVNLKTLSLAQGGSTITQQLVKNLMARRTKNIFRKFNELFLAILLEFKFEKEQILERYLNEVYLGQVGSLEVHGVAEGAKHFFGKRVDELNMGEIALMAGLIRGPGYYSPYRYKDRAMERQKLVLKKMAETGQIADAEAAEAGRLPIRLAPPVSYATRAPYFTDFVKAELIRHLNGRISEQEIPEAGFRVYTTLDPILNTEAQRAVADGIASLEQRYKIQAPERLEGALASVDQATGHIRALVGGRSYAQSTFNRILNMRRQVGSTFKPIVYLTAIRRGADKNGIPYGPAHPAEDAAWTLKYDRGKQSWSPRNYENEFRGWIPLRTALAHSINTVAARLGFEVGIPNIIETAKALGVTSDLPAVPSLSLGVAELSPIELLRVYATIANHGVQEELTVIRAITQEDGAGYARFVHHPKESVDAGSADLLSDMMRSVFIEGTARAAAAMGFDRPAAGKTGTTSNHRDAWFAGFTPQLTTVVWVGMDQSQPPTGDPAQTPRASLTGAGAALPIWVSFMKKALSSEPPAPFEPSTHLVDLSTDLHSGKLASFGCPVSQVRTEKFIKGKEPQDSGCDPIWPATTPNELKD